MSGLMPWDSVVDLLKDGIDKIFPDKTQAQAAKNALDMARQQGTLQQMQDVYDNAKAQLDVDKTDAASSSLFVSAWRPFVGWCCGGAFAYAFVVQPFLTFGCTVLHWPLDMKQLPALDLSSMMPVLLGMLGLAGMRSYEKVQGAAPPTHG